MPDYNLHRVASMALGSVSSGLGCYGAFEFAYRLEGSVSYLVIAAPVVALTAALIPPLAEATLRSGAYLKALLWWATLVPAGAVVFFAAAERVHVAKAGAQAERSALRNAASRAQAALTRSEASLAAARAEANAARAQKQCGPVCRTKLAAEAAAQADVEAAKREVLSTESKATADSPLQAPVWLLPAALDLVAFVAIWTGLSMGPVKGCRGEAGRRRRRRVRRPTMPLAASPANDNVVSIRTA
jgi:hypothetical protein